MKAPDIETFRDVVELWESPDKLAAEIGSSVVAARKWSQAKRNSIPVKWWLPILGTSKAREAGLTAETFMALARARKPTFDRARPRRRA